MAEKGFNTDVDASHVESSGTSSPENGSHHMTTEKDTQFHDVGNVHGFSADLDNLPKGYYYSPFFLGSMAGVFFGLMAGVGGFAVAAPILGLINKDIGPDPNYVWVALVYSLTLAVGLTFVGRLSDIFGRRWFFIGGALVAGIGAAVCATAKNIPTLIGGETLVGLGASAQLSFPFAMGELVPMKHRFLGNAILYISCIPMSGFGPALANAVVLYTPAGWRTGYYILIAVDGVSLICYILFYHPPTFYEKHANANLFHWIKHFDYVGAILFTGGVLLFLMGLSWGGSIYPWKSAHVLGCMIVGLFTCVAFVLWECYAPLMEPLMPMRLFRNWRWVASWVSLGLGAGQYYALAIVWPLMVTTLYAEGEPLNGGWLASVIGLGIISGQLVGGVLAPYIGKTKYQAITVFTCGGLFYGLVATCTPETKSRAIALVYIGCCFIGWNETIVLSIVTIIIDDQQEIGTATGIAGSMRALISTIMSTVYVVVLTNRLTSTIATQVPAALVGAGLPPTSVVSWLEGFGAGALQGVKGNTAAITAAGTAAYRLASADAFQTVFYTTLGFSGLGVAVSFFVPSVDDRMSGGVAAKLHMGDKERGDVEKARDLP